MSIDFPKLSSNGSSAMTPDYLHQELDDFLGETRARLFEMRSRLRAMSSTGPKDVLASDEPARMETRISEKPSEGTG